MAWVNKQRVLGWCKQMTPWKQQNRAGEPTSDMCKWIRKLQNSMMEEILIRFLRNQHDWVPTWRVCTITHTLQEANRRNSWSVSSCSVMIMLGWQRCALSKKVSSIYWFFCYQKAIHYMNLSWQLCFTRDSNCGVISLSLSQPMSCFSLYFSPPVLLRMGSNWEAWWSLAAHRC